MVEFIMNLRDVFIATRPWSFPMTILSVSLGSILAFYFDRIFDLTLYLITLVGAIALHAIANLTNDYFDSKLGIDKVGAPTTRYRPHPLIEGYMSTHDLLLIILIFTIVSLIIGIYLTMVIGPLIFILGFLGFLLAIMYSGPPIGYKYKALGEPIVFIIWGPLIVLGSYYVQTISFSANTIFTSFPIGILIAAVLLANNIRDIEYDASTGVNTIPILLGRKRATILYIIMLISAYLITLFLILTGLLRWQVFIVFISMPKALKLIRMFRQRVPDAADPITAQLVIIFGILYLIGILISTI